MTDEILAHISAPATRQNDELYRSLAGAYLQFEPHRTLADKPRQTQDESKQPSASGLDISATVNEGTPIDEGAKTSDLYTSKDSYGSFPSHISFEDQAKGCEGVASPSSSRLVRLERNYAKWKQHITPRSNSLDTQRRNQSSSHGLEDAETAFIEDTQLAAQALQSQLQDDFSTTFEDTSEDELESQFSLGQNYPPGVERARQQSENPIVEMLEPASSMSYAGSGDVSVDQDKQPYLNDHMSFSIATDHIRSEVQSQPIDRRITLKSPDSTDLPTVAFPPAPNISVTCPEILPSQITKYLATIKTHNPTRFKLNKELYSPKSDDRGHWTVKCSGWPNELRHEFWSVLYGHVVSGRLGWGTTLHRESSRSQQIGQVKLYCWGEVVEHMWLVLWLCSKGKVSTTMLKWFDADGRAILEAS